jgi:exopolyphosphatase/pppGpp-phosphohydrolase
LLKYKHYDLFFCGGNSNLICRLILGENKQNACQFLSTKDFYLWADILSKKQTKELVADFNINTEKAETILPSILIYQELAKIFAKDRIYIPYTGIREALIMD